MFGELYSRVRLDRVLTERHVRASHLLRDAALLPVCRFYQMMDALDDDYIAKMQELLGQQSSGPLGDEIGVL